MRNVSRVVLVLLLLPALVLLPASTAASERAATSSEAKSSAGTDESTLAILFVGNSLTFANDMPSMLERLLADAGYEPRVESLVYPNYSLEDHWRRRETRRAIRSGAWDYVVFQQGPSATEGRPSLLAYTKKLARLAREHGAEPALYMVWPSKTRFGDFEGVADSYRTAAESVSGLLLPVGDAWREAWKLDPDLALYGPDGFHPTGAGSLLAALVMFQRLTGIEADSLRVSASDPHAATFRLLTLAASRANAKIEASAAIVAN